MKSAFERFFAIFSQDPVSADDVKSAVPDLSGHWRLNKELSDKPPAAPADKHG